MNPVMEGLAYKPKAPKKVKDMRKHGYERTVIHHNHDGSHQIEHHPMHPAHEMTKHSAPDMEALHDHLEEMLGGKPTQQEMETA